MSNWIIAKNGEAINLDFSKEILIDSFHINHKYIFSVYTHAGFKNVVLKEFEDKKEAQDYVQSIVKKVAIKNCCETAA